MFVETVISLFASSPKYSFPVSSSMRVVSNKVSLFPVLLPAYHLRLKSFTCTVFVSKLQNSNPILYYHHISQHVVTTLQHLSHLLSSKRPEAKKYIQLTDLNHPRSPGVPTRVPKMLFSKQPSPIAALAIHVAAAVVALPGAVDVRDKTPVYQPALILKLQNMVFRRCEEPTPQ